MKGIWVPWIKKDAFIHARFQISFSDDFWLWIWMLGIRKPSMCQAFPEVTFFIVPRLFFMIWGSLGINFDELCCLGHWLEI